MFMNDSDFASVSRVLALEGQLDGNGKTVDIYGRGVLAPRTVVSDARCRVCRRAVVVCKRGLGQGENDALIKSVIVIAHSLGVAP